MCVCVSQQWRTLTSSIINLTVRWAVLAKRTRQCGQYWQNIAITTYHNSWTIVGIHIGNHHVNRTWIACAQKWGSCWLLSRSSFHPLCVVLSYLGPLLFVVRCSMFSVLYSPFAVPSKSAYLSISLADTWVLAGYFVCVCVFAVIRGGGCDSL